MLFKKNFFAFQYNVDFSKLNLPYSLDILTISSYTQTHKWLQSEVLFQPYQVSMNEYKVLTTNTV